MAKGFELSNKPLVYLLDDDEVLIKSVEWRFVNSGCEVKSFNTIEALFSSYQNKKPNLLLVDLNLGDGFSGFDVIKKIRTEYKDSIPIIILSGDNNHQNISHGLELGANDYIIKQPLRLLFDEIILQYLKPSEN